jgi:catechol 2,3-dioxygenase-like lactoylglutathione lyase family enzyme
MRLRMELFVDDLDTSVTFWTGVLGFWIDRRDDGYASLRRGSVVLGLGPVAKLPSTGDGPGFTQSRLAAGKGAGVEIVLEVDDLDAVYESCAAAGVVAEGLTDRPWGLRDFRFTDPDGYYVRVTTR